MWAALIDKRSFCCAMTSVVYGNTLKELVTELLGETEMLWEFWRVNGRTLDELEEEMECELDDFRRLDSMEDPQPEDVRDFYCSVSDASISVGCLVDSMDALRREFEEYTEDKMILNEWMLSPEMEFTPEWMGELNWDLEKLCEDGEEEDFSCLVSKWSEEDEEAE